MRMLFVYFLFSLIITFFIFINFHEFKNFGANCRKFWVKTERERGRGQNMFPWGGRKYGAGAGDGTSGTKALF